MLETLVRQRAFLMAVFAHLMDKDVDSPEDFVIFKVAIAQAFMDQIIEKGSVVGDEAEITVLKKVQEMCEKENALQQVKKDLGSMDPF